MLTGISTKFHGTRSLKHANLRSRNIHASVKPLPTSKFRKNRPRADGTRTAFTRFHPKPSQQYTQLSRNHHKPKETCKRHKETRECTARRPRRFSSNFRIDMHCRNSTNCHRRETEDCQCEDCLPDERRAKGGARATALMIRSGGGGAERAWERAEQKEDCVGAREGCLAMAVQLPWRLRFSATASLPSTSANRSPQRFLSPQDLIHSCQVCIPETAIIYRFRTYDTIRSKIR